MNKKNSARIIAIVCVIFVALWSITNLTSLGAVINKVFSVLIPIIAGGCIAFIVNILLRPIERLWIKLFSARRKGLRRAVSIILCILIAAGLAALLIGLIIPQIWRTAQGIFDKIPTYIDQLNSWYDTLSSLLKRFSVELPYYHFNADSIMSSIRGIISDNKYNIIDTSVGIVTSAFGMVFDTVFAVVIAIYILAQKERLGVGAKKILYSIFSEKNTERILALARLSDKTFSSFVTGQLTEAVILGALCFIGMLIFRIPYAALVSMLVGVTALIPIFGAFIGTGIGAFLILFEYPLKAVLFVVFILVLQQIEGNVIYPRVVGSKVGLPGLWVLVAVSIGSEFGVFGMLVSVPTASLIYTLIRQFVNARIKEKGLEDQFPTEKAKEKTKKEKRPKKNKKKEKPSDTDSRADTQSAPPSDEKKDV